MRDIKKADVSTSDVSIYIGFSILSANMFLFCLGRVALVNSKLKHS